MSVAFSHTPHIVSGAQDRTIRIWSVSGAQKHAYVFGGGGNEIGSVWLPSRPTAVALYQDRAMLL